jgi:hypothetical protein
MSAFFKPLFPVFLLAGLCALLAAGPAAADDLTGRWGLGLEGGFHKLTEGYWDYSNMDQFGSLVISRGFSPHWLVHANFKFGQIRPGAEYRGEDVGWSTKSGAPLYNSIFQPTLNLQYRFAPRSRISPWLGGGAGITRSWAWTCSCPRNWL